MALEIKKIIRTFTFNGMKLPDPGPDFSAEEVKELFTNQYPDLVTAIIDGPSITDDVAAYTFIRNVGSKG